MDAHLPSFRGVPLESLLLEVPVRGRASSTYTLSHSWTRIQLRHHYNTIRTVIIRYRCSPFFIAKICSRSCFRRSATAAAASTDDGSPAQPGCIAIQRNEGCIHGGVVCHGSGGSRGGAIITNQAGGGKRQRMMIMPHLSLTWTRVPGQ